MTLLDSHLEQIALSSTAISDLPFPPPKIFANALLHPHDITALIRDTEAHERALFSVPPSGSTVSSQDPTSTSARRQTTLRPSNSDAVGMATLGTNKAYRRKTAVAAVLGGDMVDQIRRTGAGGPAYSATAPRDRADVDVQLLLKGAERLSEVYSVPGAAEKIMSLRTRYGQLTASISHHEARVSKQTAQLDRLNKPQDYDGDDDDDLSPEQDVDVENEPDITEEDIRREEDELKELERKKKGLEERVSGMERDLGGLLR